MNYRCLLVAALLCINGCSAQKTPEPDKPPAPSLFEKSTEIFSDRNEDTAAQSSPKKGWGDFDITKQEEEPESSTLRTIALWIPNRILDFIDIFRVDLGVGPSVGGVVRVTKWAQAGMRSVSPASVRVGDFGRTWPVKVEHSSELGISPAFLQSNDRTVCPGEVGAGIDIFLVGGYGGVCFDELYDFLGGLILQDFKKDDLR